MKRFLLAALALSMFPAFAQAGGKAATPDQKVVGQAFRSYNPGYRFRTNTIDVKPITPNNGTATFTANKGPKGLVGTEFNITTDYRKGSEGSGSVSHTKIVPWQIQPRSEPPQVYQIRSPADEKK